jgi:hemin uptake protein HemP
VVRDKPQEAVNRPPEEKRVSSEALLGPKKQLLIVHNGREYCLRLTQNGKLILTA